jgi:hypothetical protein
MRMKPIAKAASARQTCGSCAHFRNDPEYLERVLSGVTSLSSGYASVLADDGICRRHQRFCGADSRCADFLAHAVAPFGRMMKRPRQDQD